MTTKRFADDGYDQLGPGTKSWNACERAIWHKLNGRPHDAQECIDEMTREMLEHRCTVGEIAHNEAYIETRVGEANPDDYHMFDE